jgi:hypothetical protein
VWYAGTVLGLSHGELFIVGFVFLAVVLAPYSGRTGQWLFRLLGVGGATEPSDQA